MKPRRIFTHLLTLLITLCLIGICRPAHALFGVGDVVFDPTMYASQLQQLQQQTAEVTNLAQQLRYIVKNTTSGDAGVWRSNQNLLANLGGLISEQQGLAYSLQSVSQQFQQLYPGYGSTSMSGASSPKASTETTLNTLNGALASAQAQAQNFQTEQATLQNLELKNQTAIGNLQAVQVSNEIALAQVQQIQMLRQLVMAQMNSQNVAAANHVNGQVQDELQAQALFSAPVSTGIPNLLHAVPAPPPQP